MLESALSGIKRDDTIIALGNCGGDTFCEDSSRIIVAGSSVATLFIGEMASNDYDVYFEGPGAFSAVFNRLVSLSDQPGDSQPLAGYRLMDQIGTGQASIEALSRLNTVNFSAKDKKPIQLVKSYWYNGPHSVLGHFDFTIVQFAYSNGEYWINPLGVLDGVAKRLVINNTSSPANTLNRIIKYTGKGFHATNATLLGLSDDIRKSNGYSTNADGLISLSAPPIY
jgi:hypothetical protein